MEKRTELSTDKGEMTGTTSEVHNPRQGELKTPVIVTPPLARTKKTAHPSQVLIAVSRFHNPGPNDDNGGGSDNKFRPSEGNVIAKHSDRRYAWLHIVAAGPASQK